MQEVSLNPMALIAQNARFTLFSRRLQSQDAHSRDQLLQFNLILSALHIRETHILLHPKV